jgi:DNA gyrase/topoisomerase IV subunit A
MTNSVNILQEIREDALNIGNEANLSRAIPYVRDGLKPSQRAVIYGAYEQGYSSKKPHVKSLKLDGLVVGSWWPHGSEYLTIARLTQPFVMNLPLLDMHGANGSQLGTPDAASSRYTEVRLAKACEDGLLKNIEKETCDWIPNYSEDKVWPKVFPALLPNLFVNGSDGMGYCYSQTWLPGNLREFYWKVREYLENGKVTYDDIYPDFPTRGTIVNKKDIAKIYETGSGTVILRGKAEIEGNIIKITELPYQVYVTPYLEQLKTLVTPNAKGDTKIPGISDIYNMSGENGMLIEIECEADPKAVLNKLYQYSNLQVSLSANQYGIIDSIPELINLQRYIEVYLAHNIEAIKREYSYELQKASYRLEIVLGLIRANSMLDVVIGEIRASKSASDAVDNLKNKFGFTENQAQAIADMRLGKLANMEIAALNKEEAQLNKAIADYNKILGSDKAQKKEFLKRLDAFVTEYGWDRRTDVQDIDLVAEKAATIAKTKVIENYTVILEENGNIKRLLTSQYKANKKAKYLAIEIAEDQKLLLISNKGFMYKLPIKQIPKAGINSMGTPINSLVTLQAKESIVAAFNGAESEEYIFFITKKGLAKKTPWADISRLSKNIGAMVMKLTEDDEILICKLINSEKFIVLYNGKEKQILSDKFIAKSRTAGGVVAVKTKTSSFITLPLL